MPNTGWTNEPPEPEPPYDDHRVQILLDALTRLPPRDFAEWRDRALEEGHEREWNAALGLAVEHIRDRLTNYPSDSAQHADAAARLDELQRLTVGDD